MICKSKRLQTPLKILIERKTENPGVSWLVIVWICAEPTHQIVFEPGNSVFVRHKALARVEFS